MRDHDLKDLMAEAISDLGPRVTPRPAEILHRAAQVRRRRRMVATASACAVATIIGGAAVLSIDGDARPSQTVSPASPSTPPITSADPRPSSLPPMTDPAAFVAAFLPAGTGTVAREAVNLQPFNTPHPLTGRYSVTKGGKAGHITVEIDDPSRQLGDGARTVDEEHGFDLCSDDAEPRNTDCRSETAADGSVFKTWRFGGGRQPGLAYEAGLGWGASLTYPDGRAIRILVSSAYPTVGFDAVDNPRPALDSPPVNEAQLAAMVRDPRWFAR